MKKLLAILLMLAMLLSMAACFDSSSSDNDEDDDEVSDSKKNNDDDDDDDDDGRNVAALKAITFEGMTVVDNESCKIEITNLEYDEVFGYTFKLSVENKTEGDLKFELEAAAANGVQLSSASFYSSVTAGKKANDTMQIREEELEKHDFAKLTEFEFCFSVEDEDYNTVVEETAIVHPYGEETVTEDFVRASQDGDNLLIDNDYLSVVVYGYEMDETYDCYRMKYYVVNKTDAKMWFHVEDVSVNDIMISGAMDIEEIYPNRAWFGSLIIWDYEFEDNDIETVEKIDFNINANTYDDRYEDNDEFVDEDFSVVPE